MTALHPAARPRRTCSTVRASLKSTAAGTAAASARRRASPAISSTPQRSSHDWSVTAAPKPRIAGERVSSAASRHASSEYWSHASK
jgi:hypothetical protein